jgi:hypothetical protein
MTGMTDGPGVVLTGERVYVLPEASECAEPCGCPLEIQGEYPYHNALILWADSSKLCRFARIECIQGGEFC